jgi:alanine dehydrogenase
MDIGIPREIKADELRVGLTPDAVHELVNDGHRVIVQHDAGAGSGFGDGEYKTAGASIVDSLDTVYASADIVVKVKEPQPDEWPLLRSGQVLFAYLHLAANRQLTRKLLESGVTAVAYETVTSAQGSLPLLAPMSRIAGRMSIQAGAHFLEAPAGGRGVLLGGVPGVPAAHVTVLGAGVAGGNAVKMAVGMQADVTVIDHDIQRLEALAERFGNRIRTEFSTAEAIAGRVREADLVVGAVLSPGRTAAKLVSADLVGDMRPGSVIVDLSIDQGGCIATSRPTTHSDPVYTERGVLHYCVANIPGAVPRTATQALVNATLPYIRTLAELGPRRAFERDPGFANGLNIDAGHVCLPALAEELAA